MSGDLVERLREPLSQLPGDDDALMERVVSDRDEAATALTEARAEIERLKDGANFILERGRVAHARALAAESELSTLRDVLVLCGELGGMGKDETPADYLRRLIDEVAGVEPLRARVREVVGPFAEQADGARLCGAELDDDWKPFLHRSYTDVDITNGHLRAARQLMEEVK